MLVAGRDILVTGYSYGENATEFTVLTLGADGQGHAQATFYISSNDYYSGSNYASRMINGKLVIHTPIYRWPDKAGGTRSIRRRSANGAGRSGRRAPRTSAAARCFAPRISGCRCSACSSR